mmetsp:Transcript_71973/g.153929  ORF Transcript_71973/g.153929 Transcript_71973/m.153929 type:complete len:477 (-) Transcript_71973:258-1688(-)
MLARALSDKPLVELVGILLLVLAHPLAQCAALAAQHRLIRRRKPDLLLGEHPPGGLVDEAVDHVGIGPLRIVLLALPRALVGVASVAIGPPIPMQHPLHEGHRLDVHKLILDRRLNDVREPYTDGLTVRGHLHLSPWLHKEAESTEKEPHQVLMAPIDHRMAVKESAYSPGVREVVVDSTQGACHAGEAGVDRDACAIDTMVHLCEESLELCDGLVDLLVSLQEHIVSLEGRRDDAANMTKRLPLLRKRIREGEVRIAEDCAVRHRIDELEPHKPAHGLGAWCVGSCPSSDALLLWICICRCCDDLRKGHGAIVLAEDIAQLLVAESTQGLLLLEVELPAILEARHHVETAATRPLGFSHLVGVDLKELCRALPHVVGIRCVTGIDQLREVCEGQVLEHMSREWICCEAPFVQELIYLGVLRHGASRRLYLPLLLQPGLVGLELAAQEALQSQRALYGVLELMVYLEVLVLKVILH